MNVQLYQGTQEVSGLLDDQKWMEADKVIRNMVRRPFVFSISCSV